MKHLVSCLVVLLSLASCARTPGDIEYTREPAKPVKTLIFVDAGHGGQDNGTHCSQKPVVNEKDLTLKTALMVREYLYNMGYDVEMSRKTDVFIPLLERVDRAHKANADLFVSVHYNSAPSADANGVEIYYYDAKSSPQRSGASKQLASSVLASITSATHQRGRGVRSGDFAVIRETRIPAILIEAGFLTNESEMGRLRNPRYLNRIAWAIAEGVDTYVNARRP